MNHAMNRRRFLIGAGGASLALPFLESTGVPVVQAASQGPKRLIVVLHNMGTRLNEWAQPLGGQDATGSVDFEFGRILSPLEPIRDKCLYLWGVDNKIPPICKSNGHNASNRTIFTAQPFSSALTSDGSLIPRSSQEVSDSHAAGPSIDQVLGERLQDGHPHKSVNLVAGGRGGETGYLFAGKDDPLHSHHNPIEALDTYIPVQDDDAQAAAAERARRLSVLDAVRGNFNELKARVGRDDATRLEAHADKLRDLENRIQSFRECGRPAISSSNELGAFDTIGVQQDLLVQALSCDIAPVGSLIINDDFDGRSYRDASGDDRPYVPSGYDNWHDLVHRGGTVDDGKGGVVSEEGLIEGFRWHSERFVDLVQKLDAVDEGAGTMLDNTLVLWASMFGNGAGHNNRKLHLVLAGNAGAGIQMGRCLKYAEGDALHPNDWGKSDHHINHLYVSILRAFGFEEQRFGYYAEGMTDGGLLHLL